MNEIHNTGIDRKGFSGLDKWVKEAKWSRVEDEFEVRKKLGAGFHGTVYSARDKVLGIDVVLKIISKKFILEKRGEEGRENLIREIMIMGRLPESRHLGKLYRVVKNLDTIMISMRDNGDISLRELLNKSNGYRLSERSARKYFIQLLEGLQTLHNNNIYHLDIKPENLMVDLMNHNLRIIDFGFSRTENEEIDFVYGSQGYQSFESISGMKTTPKDIDIWRAGITLYELVFGFKPFGDSIEGPINFYSLVFVCDNSFVGCQNSYGDIVSISFVNLIHSILTRDHLRISIIDILNHPWMKQKD